jgi:hypothetical protein
MNPIIKFTTLFGLLAVELAVQLTATKGNLHARAGGRVLPRVVLVRVPVVLRHANPERQRGVAGHAG